MKKSTKRKIEELSKFLVVLLLFSLLMLFILWLRPDMTLFQRQVAYHSTIFLIPLHPKVYTYCIDVPKNVQQLEDIKTKLSQFPLTLFVQENMLSFCGNPYREDEEILDIYVHHLREKGLKVYVSKARISAGNVMVDIIPECVGWIGIFAMAALIVGYPRADKKKKGWGLLICLPIIYLVNLIRVASVVWAGYLWGLDAMVLVHNILWEFLLLTVSLLLWIFWIKYVVEQTF